MPQNSYQEIADQTIKSFINAVVLIDDHWAEAQNAPILPDVDSSQLNFGPTAIPPEGIKDETITTDSSEDTSNSMSVTDPSYLREIGEEIIKQGFLFTGFSYTDACKETAFKLASKSDRSEERRVGKEC